MGSSQNSILQLSPSVGTQRGSDRRFRLVPKSILIKLPRDGIVQAAMKRLNFEAHRS